MSKTLSLSGASIARGLTLVAFTVALSACGGGSGDDTDTTIGGVNNNNGNFTPIVDNDFDNDGLADSNDPDVDGDGINDADVYANGDAIDAFIDLDNNGLDDFFNVNLGQSYEGTAYAADLASVTETAVCGSVSGSDAFAITDAWNDNCTIARSISANGIFADSLYAVGIQRILYCSDVPGIDTTQYPNYTVFADGEYGADSEAAMKTFQASRSLTDDGVVGPNTWAALYDVLTADPSVSTERQIDELGNRQIAYSFDSGPCAGIPLFYQDYIDNSDGEGTSETYLQWRLAKNTPNQGEAITFSIEPPFSGRLD